MAEITLQELICETEIRATHAADAMASRPITGAADLKYYRGVLAVLNGYRAVAENLEGKK